MAKQNNKKGSLIFNKKLNRIIDSKTGRITFFANFKYPNKFKNKREYQLTHKYLKLGTTKKVSKKEEKELILKRNIKDYEGYRKVFNPIKERTLERQGKFFNKDTGKFEKIKPVTAKEFKILTKKEMSDKTEERYRFTNIKTYAIMIHPEPGKTPRVFTEPTGKDSGTIPCNWMMNNYGADNLILNVEAALEEGYFFDFFSSTYKVYNKLYKFFEAHKVFKSYLSFKSYYRNNG